MWLYVHRLSSFPHCFCQSFQRRQTNMKFRRSHNTCLSCISFRHCRFTQYNSCISSIQDRQACACDSMHICSTQTIYFSSFFGIVLVQSSQRRQRLIRNLEGHIIPTWIVFPSDIPDLHNTIFVFPPFKIDRHVHMTLCMFVVHRLI